MLDWFLARPGRLYVAATLLPLAAFAFLLVLGLVRTVLRRTRPGADEAPPGRAGAWLAVAAIAASCVLSVVGLVQFLHDAEALRPQTLEQRYSARTVWAQVGPMRVSGDPEVDPHPAMTLTLGYRIDHLTAVLFVMITSIATLIFLFSVGYMHAETGRVVEDHAVPTRGGTLERRGRYETFFLYLSLFCFSMLNLVLADNLFQVFISWELVGICSFFLIGFYFERPSAALAANKAFIVNRVGDVGFVIGLVIFWTYAGTFNFQELFQKVRCPPTDSHGSPCPVAFEGRILRGDPPAEDRSTLSPAGSVALLFPGHWHADDLKGGGRVRAVPLSDDERDFIPIPYWLLTVAGLGIFLGCVGKSAQFPLHVWLPDAMEGPTPVSALIHAATMVAAGVYLVGRAFPLFTPEALVVVAYTGAITLFIAATIAVVMTDIKRVLAYSTVSQLGFMMLALGVGGWVAGLLHLVTHACFKALLFLGAGSVIHGCHDEQDLRKMGGLRKKMPVTAYTMLAGVLAISGTPFFSGWYSKDAILAAALGYVRLHPEHYALFLLPLLTAGLTCFYMLRLWLLAFTGPPHDADTYAHAHESPWVMTLPLVVLAALSVGVAWGWPPTDPEASYLGEHLLNEAKPAVLAHEFGPEEVEALAGHALAGWLALATAGLGALLALAAYAVGWIDAPAASRRLGPLTRFLERKWYFDDLYRAAILWPTLYLAAACQVFDKRTGDASVTEIDPLATPDDHTPAVPRREGGAEVASIDGVANLIGRAVMTVGKGLRTVQTGSIRGYVLVLALTAVAIFAILSYLTSRSAVG